MKWNMSFNSNTMLEDEFKKNTFAFDYVGQQQFL